MAVKDHHRNLPEDVLALAQEHRGATGLVLLPDEIAQVGDDLVAGFRIDAQALRVAALEQGIDVVVALPSGTRAGYYSEHHADWVLPLILGIPSSVVATLVATHLQERFDAWRSRETTRTPVVRYREVTTDSADGSARLREIEGPVDEVMAWLREERGAERSIGED